MNGTPETGAVRPLLREDGREVVEPVAFREGDFLYACGQADDVDAGTRGNGPHLRLTRSTPGDSELDFGFVDDVVLKGGAAHWLDAGLGDSLSLLVYAPATAVTPNGTNEGNANLVDVGGGVMIIVPAAGDGAYDVDLTEATPVPNTGGTGFYDRDVDGNPTPNVSQEGGYDLFPFAPVLVRHVVGLPLLGAGTFDLADPFVKPKTVLKQWRLRVTLHKETDDAVDLVVAWWLQTGRQVTTNVGDVIS